MQLLTNKITNIGMMHVSVGLKGQINHIVRSFWETESIRIATEKEIKECDEMTVV